LSISYVLNQRKNTYNDYRDDIQYLVEQNPNQMSFEEYVYLYELITSKKGCNLLIFGLGRDSMMWLHSNTNGKTIFLEDNKDWINTVKIQMSNINQQIDIREVTYTDVGYDADRLLSEYKSGTNNLKLNLPSDILDTKWDVILVDAPAGYGNDVPCRMKSIYESYSLSNKNPNTDVIVHDAERRIEKLYTDYFFKTYNHIKTIDDKQHGVLQHYRSVDLNG
tara:strand:- start:295 stop:957 length:663 start_codon:yes stop_codon:yes gene_type:complete